MPEGHRRGQIGTPGAAADKEVGAWPRADAYATRCGSAWPLSWASWRFCSPAPSRGWKATASPCARSIASSPSSTRPAPFKRRSTICPPMFLAMPGRRRNRAVPLDQRKRTCHQAAGVAQERRRSEARRVSRNAAADPRPSSVGRAKNRFAAVSRLQGPARQPRNGDHGRDVRRSSRRVLRFVRSVAEDGPHHQPSQGGGPGPDRQPHGRHADRHASVVSRSARQPHHPDLVERGRGRVHDRHAAVSSIAGSSSRSACSNRGSPGWRAATSSIASTSRRGDEIESFANAYNDMTGKLHDLYRDLAQQVNERSRQLVRSERLAGVGFLAAGVAHEINNPLASIAFCGEALETRLGELLRGPRQGKRQAGPRDRREVSEDDSGRGVSLQGDHAEAARLQPRRRAQAREDRSERTRPERARHRPARPQLARERRITFTPAANLVAWVNAQEIKQVFLNLVVNALDSMDEGGTLTIAHAHRGDTIELSFKDTGCGMSEEMLENIFEPFFTRSRTGKGTGLGLSISHRIITAHGGEIEATSAGLNRGARSSSACRPRSPRTTSARTRWTIRAKSSSSSARLSNVAPPDRRRRDTATTTGTRERGVRWRRKV